MSSFALPRGPIWEAKRFADLEKGHGLVVEESRIFE